MQRAFGNLVRRRRWWNIAVTWVAMLTIAWGGDVAQQGSVGELDMALATTSSSGVEYRLRAALFEIRGPEDQDIQSEDFPADDTTISVSVQSGDYLVTLVDGWFMEHRAPGISDFTPGGPARSRPTPTDSV